MSIPNRIAKKVEHVTGVDPNMTAVSICKEEGTPCVEYAALCLVADVLRTRSTLQIESTLIDLLRDFQKTVGDFQVILRDNELPDYNLRVYDSADDLRRAILAIRNFFNWCRYPDDIRDENTPWRRIEDFIEHRSGRFPRSFAADVAPHMQMAESLLRRHSQGDIDEEVTSLYVKRMVSSPALSNALRLLRRYADMFVDGLLSLTNDREEVSKETVRNSFANCTGGQIRSKFLPSHDSMPYRPGGALATIWREDSE